MTEDRCSGIAPHARGFDASNPLAERRTLWVLMLTAVAMVLEIVAGWWYGSMALLADGWHMSSHVIALGLSVAAYVLARRLRRDDRFAFGTWKIEVLGGYTSALLLVGVVLYMAIECLSRLRNPRIIAYDQALGVAFLGLLVNLGSAALLAGAARREVGSGSSHTHSPHAHPHVPGHDDLNLRAAYVHVAADAATSLLAIGALAGGKFLRLVWLDAAVGLFASAVVAAWAWSLLRSTSRILLDAEMGAPVVEKIRQTLRGAPLPAQIQDLHVWRVGKGSYACILSVASSAAV
ncbi:MAG TPA: CDF family Co(II)/Ni(II) efflux transporter DmeF, partial [Steroidobacteraceae bacterium]|nr:CDF family Co(II)/Ni(II) efflux transporter DmeF [Steroidobacteraceae bacterium]